MKIMWFAIMMIILVGAACNDSVGDKTLVSVDSVSQGKTGETGISENFQKYSHLLWANRKNGRYRMGTFFLMRYRGVLFLLTASHCLTDWDPVHNIPAQPSRDTTTLRFFKSDNSGVFRMLMNTRSIKNDPTVKKSCFVSPDFYIAKLHSAPAVRIDEVGNYCDTLLPSDKPDSLFFWGYPVMSYGTDTLDMPTVKPLLCVCRPDGSEHLKKDKKSKLPDINYTTVPVTQIKEKGGFSGSPVFWVVKNKIVFGGIAFGQFDEKIAIIRPQIIYQYIDSIYFKVRG